MARFLNSAAFLRRSRWWGKFLPNTGSLPPAAPGAYEVYAPSGETSYVTTDLGDYEVRV